MTSADRLDLRGALVRLEPAERKISKRLRHVLSDCLRSRRQPVSARLLVGLVFPLVVSWAAIQTARTRSMESATGLLYINVGTIAAGTILAAGLYFGAGLLV